ncbi:hypothetical protein HY631_01640 [Candidatus Uhrbacteria bacterium]|nr:hypothetical protein [Candidatus Uhrbacteria bacterium]
MKKTHLLFLALLGVLLIAGCAPDANAMVDTAVEGGSIAGFWLGVWHGVIIEFTFVISLFSDSVGMYEIHNNGGWYDFGFLLGAVGAIGVLLDFFS